MNEQEPNGDGGNQGACENSIKRLPARYASKEVQHKQSCLFSAAHKFKFIWERPCKGCNRPYKLRCVGPWALIMAGTWFEPDGLAFSCTGCGRRRSSSVRPGAIQAACYRAEGRVFPQTRRGVPEILDQAFLVA